MGEIVEVMVSSQLAARLTRLGADDRVQPYKTGRMKLGFHDNLEISLILDI